MLLFLFFLSGVRGYGMGGQRSIFRALKHAKFLFILVLPRADCNLFFYGYLESCQGYLQL